MRAIIYLSIWALALLFTACDSEVKGDLGLRDYENKIVVNAAVSVDHPLRVQVSRSKGILSADPYQYVSDAVVQVVQNGESTALTHDALGLYRGNHSLSSQQSFKIEVTTSEGTVIGEDEIPAPVKITSLQHTDTVGFLGLGRTVSRTALTWKDPSGEKNYYELLMYQQVDDTVDFMPMNTTSLSVKNNSSGDVLSSGDDYINQFLISDDLFDGQEFTLEVFALTPRDDAPVYVSLKSLSANYYEYLIKKQLSAENADDPFAEPVSAASNVQNGLGIVAGYSLDVDTIP